MDRGLRPQRRFYVRGRKTNALLLGKVIGGDEEWRTTRIPSENLARAKVVLSLEAPRATLTMTITFAKPPLNEVVLGLSFLPRPDFLVPLFGKFWGEISDRYPKIAHAAPFVAPGVLPIQDPTGAWLPRVWFVSSDDCMVVQLQQDCIFMNWRQTEKNEEYPRFPFIRDEFYRVWELFRAFLELETGTPPLSVRAELTYVNSIPQGDRWQTVADFGGVLVDFRWKPEGRYLPSPRRFAGNFEFELADGTTLSAKIGIGTRLADQKEMLRLELAASRMLNDGVEMKDWIELAHDHVVRAFKDLTTTEMHRNPWQLEEEKNG